MRVFSARRVGGREFGGLPCAQNPPKTGKDQENATKGQSDSKMRLKACAQAELYSKQPFKRSKRLPRLFRVVQ